MTICKNRETGPDYSILNDALSGRPRGVKKEFTMSDLVLQGRFKVQVVEDGKVIEDRPFEKNLIMDLGMDNIASNEICDLFLSCSSGTGTTAQKVDSGATTASRLGNTVTSSASFFGSGDVGKLIKWDSGEEARITVYNSGTSVTVDTSGTIGSGAFTMWNVALTSLASYHADYSSYLTGSGNCGTSRSGSTLTHRRTFDFPAEAGSVAIEELSVAAAGGGSNIFSRILLSSTVNLTIGQQLRVIYELDVTLSPTTLTANTPSATGWPVAPATGVDGDEMWQAVQMSAVDTSTGATVTTGTELAGGESGAGASMDPFTSTSGTLGSWAFISSDATAHNTFPSAGPDRSSNAVEKELAHDAYSNGTFTRTRSCTFAVGEANRTDWRSVGVGNKNSTAGYRPYQGAHQGLVFIFDEEQTKENTHTLTLTFRWTWSQTLTN